MASRILISKDYDEVNDSYIEVIDWLLFLKCKISYFSGKSYYSEGNDWEINLSTFKSSSIEETPIYDSYWFRGFIRYRPFINNIIEDMHASNDSISELKLRLSHEIRKVNNIILGNVRAKYYLPKIESTKIDKFTVLRQASDLGIQVPTSMVTNSKKKLVDFCEKYGKVISKPLYEVLYFQEESKTFFFKTQLVDITDSKISDNFFPSLFQEYIDKKIELRIFFLNGEFYPMAIFSQLDSKTSIDFRNYNNGKPNRSVPYKLPEEIEIKLTKLMQLLDLNTGSIDLIKDNNNNYVFLEVNPTGQFGFNSKPCNYHLEYKIAQALNNGK